MSKLGKEEVTPAMLESIASRLEELRSECETIRQGLGTTSVNVEGLRSVEKYATAVSIFLLKIRIAMNSRSNPKQFSKATNFNVSEAKSLIDSRKPQKKKKPGP